jgi:putative addiction module antidote
MVYELKLRKIGNSVGVVFPKEVLAHFKVSEGDTIVLTEGVDNTMRLSSSNPEFTRQMEAAQDIIQRYRNTLRELAK